MTTFLNSGGGVFGPGVVVDAIRQQISDLALGDVTGDGIPEIAIAAQLPVSAPAVVVDAATGAVVHGGLPAALDVELADADGDGDLDLFVDGSLRLNLGATLSPPQQFATNAANGRQLAFDADVDGDVDVLHWQGSTGATLWTNGGGGVQWTPQAVPYPGTALPPQNWTPATPIYRSADVDRDGDPDLFDVFGRAATNCARQIARANPASIGRSTGLEIYGAPNRPVDLFASFAAFQTPIAVPGWGPLFLPPPTAAFVGTFATGGDGRVAIPLSVPLSPAFVGLTFHWQAAFPTEGRLTGALRTTVEAF